MPRSKDLKLKYLKRAIELFGLGSVKAWTETLTNPDGESAGRTLVYKAIEQQKPQWMCDKITSLVRDAINTFGEEVFYSPFEQELSNSKTL